MVYKMETISFDHISKDLKAKTRKSINAWILLHFKKTILSKVCLWVILLRNPPITPRFNGNLLSKRIKIVNRIVKSTVAYFLF